MSPSGAADRPCKILCFSDTYGIDAGNGVARFLTDLRQLSHRQQLPLQLIVPGRQPSEPGLHRVRAPSFVVPGYEALSIATPLKHHRKIVQRMIREQRPDCIHVSTPGPFGWFGVHLAQRHKLPLVGIYHSDFPGFAAAVVQQQLEKARQQPSALAWPWVQHWLPYGLPLLGRLQVANPDLTRDVASLLEIFHRNRSALLGERELEPTIVAAAAELVRWLMEKFYAQFDCVVSRSPGQQASIAASLRYPVEKIRCLRPGTDLERFHPRWADRSIWSRFGIPAEATIALHVGRITAEKNIPFLMECWQRVRRSTSSELHLVMVGNGDTDRWTHPHSLPNVHFIGAHRGSVLSQLYASADLLLFPAEAETLGQVGLEGSASGIPVIVADRGGPATYVEHGVTGYVLPTTDPQLWADHVLALDRDRTRGKALGAAARRHLEQNFSIEQSVNSYWEIHEQTVRARAARRGKGLRIGNAPVDPLPDAAAGPPRGVMFVSDFHAGKHVASAAQRERKQGAIRAMLTLAVEHDWQLVLGGDFADHSSRQQRLEEDFQAFRRIRQQVGGDPLPVFLRGNHDFGFSDERLQELLGGCRIATSLVYHCGEADVVATHGHILGLNATVKALDHSELDHGELDRGGGVSDLLDQLREERLDQELKPALIAYDLANMIETGLGNHGLRGLNTVWESLYATRAAAARSLLKATGPSGRRDESTWRLIASLISVHDNVEVAARLASACGGWATLFGHTHQPLAERRSVPGTPDGALGTALVGNAGRIHCRRPTCVVARFPEVCVFQYSHRSGQLRVKARARLQPDEIAAYLQRRRDQPVAATSAASARQWPAA